MNAYNDHARMQSDELTYAHHGSHPNGSPPSQQRQHPRELDLVAAASAAAIPLPVLDSDPHSLSNGDSSVTSQPPPLHNGLLHHTHHHDQHHQLGRGDSSSPTGETMSTTGEASLDAGVEQVEDAHASLTSQSLNTDGTPKRPMNAFMIFARRRRPQVSAANQTMRTGEISKILSREWNGMCLADKQFYLDQAKKLKENFNSRYPDYVYRRRPNNSRKRRRTGSVDSPYTRPGEGNANGAGDDDGLGGGVGDSPPEQPLLSPLSPTGGNPFDFTRSTSYSGSGGEFLDNQHSHHLPYPERFNQLAWPPLNHSKTSGSRNQLYDNAPTHPVESSTPWGSSSTTASSTTTATGPPKLDPLKIVDSPGSRNNWFLDQQHHIPTRHRSLSHLSLEIKSENGTNGPFTPSLNTAPGGSSSQRPWSSSTSSGSSDSSHPPHQTLSPNPFDAIGTGGGGGGGYYPSPTSAPAPVQSPTAPYFGGAGSGHLDHHHHHHNHHQLYSPTSPNYLPTTSSRTTLPYDPLAPRSTQQNYYPQITAAHHHAHTHHGLSTSHNANDEPHRSAIGQDNFPWDGKSD